MVAPKNDWLSRIVCLALVLILMAVIGWQLGLGLVPDPVLACGSYELKEVKRKAVVAHALCAGFNREHKRRRQQCGN